MIFGIGTDIVAVKRIDAMFSQHGIRSMEKILSKDEFSDCQEAPQPGRFMAKRFAAKEALGKALGTGIRTPVLLPAIAVFHDEFGKPLFSYSADLASWMDERRLSAYLSLSDEEDFVVAFVVVEKSA